MTNAARRQFVLSGSALAVAAAVVGSDVGSLATAHGESLPTVSPNGVKALCFDVFGTLVDWRTGLARDAERVLKPLGYSIDWSAFADAWRDQYQPGMDEVRWVTFHTKLRCPASANAPKYRPTIRLGEARGNGPRPADTGMAPPSCMAGRAGRSRALAAALPHCPLSNGNMSRSCAISRARMTFDGMRYWAPIWLGTSSRHPRSTSRLSMLSISNQVSA